MTIIQRGQYTRFKLAAPVTNDRSQRPCPGLGRNSPSRRISPRTPLRERRTMNGLRTMSRLVTALSLPTGSPHTTASRNASQPNIGLGSTGAEVPGGGGGVQGRPTAGSTNETANSAHPTNNRRRHLGLPPFTNSIESARGSPSSSLAVANACDDASPGSNSNSGSTRARRWSSSSLGVSDDRWSARSRQRSTASSSLNGCFTWAPRYLAVQCTL